jgi:hypothetical protein
VTLIPHTLFDGNAGPIKNRLNDSQEKALFFYDPRFAADMELMCIQQEHVPCTALSHEPCR